MNLKGKDMISPHDMIDPHVHCRDGKQTYKGGTIRRVFEIARQQGVKKIIDMPNPDPPILTEEDVLQRLGLVPKTEVGNYFLYLGLTSDSQQLEKAAIAYRKIKEIVGFKLYTIESGSKELAVVEEEKQRRIYTILSALEYTGVIAVHCEKKDLMKPELWNPLNPLSHSWARPKEAEIESIRDQIRFANQAGFKGTLHIVHVSCPESVELIKAARENIKITCGVTPHHLLFADRMQLERGGLIYKTNPPLRSLEDIEALRYCLLRGEIDWIESDHAPHALDEKIFPPYCSGFPSLCLYKELVEDFLPRVGASPDLIRRMTHDNIIKVFGNKIGGESG